MKTLILAKDETNKKPIDARFIFALLAVYFANASTSEFILGSLLKTALPWSLAMVFFGVWLIWTLFEDRRELYRIAKIISPLFFCIAVIYICQTVSGISNIDIDKVNKKSQLWFLLMYSVITVYYIRHNSNCFKVLLYVSLLDLLVGMCYSVYILDKYPLLARYMSTGDPYKHILEEYALYDLAITAGVISFFEVYGITMMMPILVYKIFTTPLQKRLWYIGFTIISFVALFFAQFSIAIILAIVAVLMVLCYFAVKKIIKKLKEKTPQEVKKIVWIAIASVAVVLLLLVLFLDDLLLAIVNLNVLPYEINVRLHEIYKLIYLPNEMQGTDIMVRFDLYLISIKSIINNYGLGNFVVGYGQVSGHSELLDVIANYGVIFFVFICMFFIRYFNEVKSHVKKDKRIMCNFCMIIFLLSSILNTSLWVRGLGIIICITPLLIVIEEKS